MQSISGKSIEECKKSENGKSSESDGVFGWMQDNVITDDSVLWSCIVTYQSRPFYTASGLPFTYTIKIGKKGQLTKELIIDRREQSKTLTWSSIRVAFNRVMEDKKAGRGVFYPKPKAIGDIRGISYIYPLFWKFGIIEVPEVAAEKMGGET